MENKKIERLYELVDLINKYNEKYYVEDESPISDKEFDALLDELKLLEKETGLVLPNSPTVNVGGSASAKFSKHKHLAKLYSLDKTNNYEELSAILNDGMKYTKPRFSVEFKFDGLTICLHYNKGKFIDASTRGDGEIGEDVTAQLLAIQKNNPEVFPLTISELGEMEVRGEAIMPISALNKYNETAEEPLKNARNGVSGAIRNLDTAEVIKRGIIVYFYDITYSEKAFKSQEEMYKFFMKEHFEFIPPCIVSLSEVIDTVKGIDAVREHLDFLIDGAVVKLNDVSDRALNGTTSKFPKWAIAFKFEAEEVTTILKNVVWQVGRTGKLTPVAELDPVELCGVTISRATLNNMDDINRKKVKIGCRVLIRRSNEVIPEILGATEYHESDIDITEPKICPECGGKVVKNGVNLFCSNPNCKQQVISSILHFVSKSGTNIEGLAESTIEALYSNKKISTVIDLYKLTADDFANMQGFGEKKISNILKAIESSKNVSQEQFLYALGLPGVGVTTSKDLISHFGTFESFKNAKVDELLMVKDIGETTAKGIYDWLNNTNNKALLDSFKSLYNIPKTQKIEKASGALSGETIVITGTLKHYKRSDMQKLLEDNGATIGSSVTKQTTILVCGEDAGSKLDKAKQLGIPIMSEAEILQKIGK